MPHKSGALGKMEYRLYANKTEYLINERKIIDFVCVSK